MADMPSFEWEAKYWRRGFENIAGVDEVGRGALAGPVVSAAVVFASNFTKYTKFPAINDSKKLTSRQRESASEWIKSNALTWGVGVVPVSIINRKGIVKATHSSFRRAISNARNRNNSRIDFLLIDAFYIPLVRGIQRSQQKAIIHGDELSFSIAAASILAKVERDKIMTNLSDCREYEEYGWQDNKGYGTKKHTKAILHYGICKQHRTKFVRNFI